MTDNKCMKKILKMIKLSGGGPFVAWNRWLVLWEREDDRIVYYAIQVKSR